MYMRHPLLLACLLLTMAMYGGNAIVVRRPAPHPQLDPEVTADLVRNGHTKISMAKTLCTLSKAGMLKDCDGDNVSVNGMKRQLTAASKRHAYTNTPYGPLVQSIDLGIAGCERWEYLHPFAFLYQLSAVSPAFAQIMRSVCTASRPLRIVIYADGLIPGNPFRPEASRKLMCIYWCIADWPGWLLQRSFAWPVFGILRESLIADIQGGLGRIMRIILRVFFAEIGPSFTTGITINGPHGDPFIVKGIFAGFLADLLGHKEITGWKGTGGIFCCLTCGNVVRIRHPKAGQVSIACHNPDKFQCLNNDDIFHIVDQLELHKDIANFDKLETDLGFNYEPHGILLDKGLRDIYQPANHTIRDWMHTVGQDGLANSHIAMATHTIKSQMNIGLDHITDFAALCHYPSKWGKLDKSAFGEARLKNTTISSFASTILTMVVVFHMFLEKFVADVLPDVFAAFTDLHHIMGIFRMGSEDSMKHIDTLRKLIKRHMKEFVRLYGTNVKPKAHHLFHVIDGMEWLGRLLSCFVTERKHRDVKRAALYVFRHLEHTVLVDLVNTTFQQVADGHDLYNKEFLVTPHNVHVDGRHMRRARSAVLRIGLTSHGDMIVSTTGVVGTVINFWQFIGDATFFVEIDAHECINNDTRFRSKDRVERLCLETSSIVDSLVWVYDSPSIIRVSLPPALLFM